MSGNGWESNPHRLSRPDTDFEDQEAHRDLTIPTRRIMHKGIFFNIFVREPGSGSRELGSPIPVSCFSVICFWTLRANFLSESATEAVAVHFVPALRKTYCFLFPFSRFLLSRFLFPDYPLPAPRFLLPAFTSCGKMVLL